MEAVTVDQFKAAMKADKEFGCHMFKTGEVMELIDLMDDWSIMLKMIHRKGTDDSTAGLFQMAQMWDALRESLHEKWESDHKKPIITLNKTEEVALNALADMFATLVFNNTDTNLEKDRRLMTIVTGMFRDVNAYYGAMTTEARLMELEKRIIKNAPHMRTGIPG